MSAASFSKNGKQIFLAVVAVLAISSPFRVKGLIPVSKAKATFKITVSRNTRPLFIPGTKSQTDVSYRQSELWSSLSDSESEGSDSGVDAAARRAGLLVLFTVPMAWGTFEPAVRFVYDIQPNVPPFVFQFVYYLIAANALAILSSMDLGSSQILQGASNSTDLFYDQSSVTSTMSLSLRGGLELGTYLFLGNAMQVVGLKTIPSDRAAFLLQLTTIFVPLLQSIVARDLSILPARTWAACVMALSGVALIGLDGNTGSVNTDSLSLVNGLSFSQGDLYILLAALFYTFHCLRLEVYAKQTSAIRLAVAKASTETLWCGVAILASLLAAVISSDVPSDSTSVLDLAKTFGNNILTYKDMFLASLQDESISGDEWSKLAAATAWIGLVPVAYTISAQSFGQARVPPATANLIYTAQPIFTALVAFFVLGESLGTAGYAGGLLIGAAVVLVTKNEEEPIEQ